MHVKHGTDERGRFVIHYGGPNGITWERGRAADAYFAEVEPQPTTRFDGIASAMNAASGVIGSVAAVADAIASLLQWWETRQARLHREQKEETDQRLRMVTDLLDRWILEHARGGHLDFKLAHYLARECLGLLRHAGDKDGAIVPMSLLYELERVRAIVTGVRSMIIRQFLTLQGCGVKVVASPVEGGAPLHINYETLASFFRSAEDEWNSAVSAKNVKEFEAELQQIARNPEAIIAKIFDVSQVSATELALALSPTATLLRSAVVGATINIAKAAMRGTLPGVVWSISSAIERWSEAKTTERKDAVRELVLFAIEIERASLLWRAWNIVDQTVRATRGVGLLILETADAQPVIAARGEDGRFRSIQEETLGTRILPAIARVAPSGPLVLPPATDPADGE